jgi:hypothetical protein
VTLKIDASEFVSRVARAAAARTKWIDDMVHTWMVSEHARVVSKADRYRKQLEEQAGIPANAYIVA